jgi:molybdopterin synthase sulfur carrier subunit
MAKLVFLGRLEDLAGMAEITMPVARGATLSAVLDRLPAELVAALTSPKIRVAVNGAIVATDRPFEELVIEEPDEIAFLPPVSGG